MPKPPKTPNTTIHHGPLEEVLPTLPENSIDAACTDPPYELTATKRATNDRRQTPREGGQVDRRNAFGRPRLGGGGFMGMEWDATGVAFDPRAWAALYRVLKPGAFLVAFGATRTAHRMVCAIEDAGFEIRDSLCWLYGEGMPKSHNISKAIDKSLGVAPTIIGEHPNPAASIFGTPTAETVALTAPTSPEAKAWAGFGTALKPAHEPICLAWKPFDSTIVANVLRHGTGALNIDASRIEGPKRDPGFRDPSSKGIWGGAEQLTNWKDAGLGRWPANVVLAHAPDCEDGACVEGCAVRMLDEQTRDTVHGAGAARGGGLGTPGRVSMFIPNGDTNGSRYGDIGGASRFFYCAKPSKRERNLGLNGHKNPHPTVKPVTLMRYLVRMITPPGGTVIDQFMGSGTTGMAAVLEGRHFIGVDKTKQYVGVARRRIASAHLLAGRS